MAFSNSNDWIRGRIPVLTPAGCELVAQRYTLDLTTGDLALNNAGQVGFLPAGMVPVDVHIDASDLDSSTAALVLQVGILNSGATDLSTAAADGGAHWGATVAANTAFHQRIVPNLRAMASVTASPVDRPLGIKVATAPTTAVAGSIGVTLFYRAA